MKQTSIKSCASILVSLKKFPTDPNLLFFLVFNFSHAINQLRPKQGNGVNIPSLYSLSMARYAEQKTQYFNLVNSWAKVCFWNGMVGGHGGAKVRLWWRDVKVCYDSGILYKLKWFDRFTPFNLEMTMWHAISYIWSILDPYQEHLPKTSIPLENTFCNFLAGEIEMKQFRKMLLIQWKTT